VEKRRRTPVRRRPTPRELEVERRSLPLVRELARLAALDSPAPVKLHQALDALFGAYGAPDRRLALLLLAGWARAQSDKRYRLTMAWLREQIRLSIEDILREGLRVGAFRADLQPAAAAAIMVSAAESSLLQGGAGGAVEPRDLAAALLRLALGGA
jgi:hypothetical protein